MADFNREILNDDITLTDEVNDMFDQIMEEYRLEKLKETETTSEDTSEELSDESGTDTIDDKVITFEEYKPTTSSYTGSSYYSKTLNYNCMGRKNETDFPEFVEICKMSQMELKLFLTEELLKAGYTDIISADGYLYAKGTDKVLVTAHMDTVHHELIKDFYEYYDEERNEHIISSPQGIGGDDRCGVYMILEIIKEFRPSVLFCEDEEIGGVGSKKFCTTEFIMELSELNYMIELDRAHGTDAVFYSCDNPAFTKFIEDNTGYVESFGSFSDISTLAPTAKVAAVNLSCGYYNAHTTSEYVIMEEMFYTIAVVKQLLALEDVEQYEYIKKQYSYSGNYYGGYGSSYYNKTYDEDYWREYYRKLYDDDYDDEYYNPNKTKSNVSNSAVGYDDEITMEIMWCNEDNQEVSSVYVCHSEMEGIGEFLINHPNLCYNDILDYYVL